MAGSFRTLFTVGVLLATSIARADESLPAPSTDTKLTKEYLERWTPGGNTNEAGVPYPHVTASYQTEGDPDWVDGRWQLTDKGPFLSHSILLPGHTVGAKLIAVTVGKRNFFLYDLLAGSFVAGVTDGELRTDPARFGLLNRPQLLGDVAFFVPADIAWRRGQPTAIIPAEGRDYQGLHAKENRILFVNRIAGIEVLESALPVEQQGVLTREIELAPRDETYWLAIVGQVPDITLAEDRRSASWTDKRGTQRTITLDAATAGVELAAEAAVLLLRWPGAASPASARFSYSVHQQKPGITIHESSSFAALPQLASWRQPGPGRWGKPLATTGVLAPDGEDLPYVVDRIDPPRDNPFRALFYISGLDFFSNGDAAVCTAHGDVWIVRGLDHSLKSVTWQRFATGLYQPLGLEIVDDRVIVLGRDQLTRLHDQNGDGEADFYESFNHDLIDSGLPHTYAMRLQQVPDDSFVFVKAGEGPHGSALLRLSADGERLEVVARGFRHPFGLGAGPNGEITVADSEGNWVPSSKIDLIQPGGFYGFLGSAESQGESPPPARPLCYIPKVADNSCGGQFWHTSDSWGPYHRGGMFHFSWGRCTLHAVLTQSVGDVQQGATVQIPGVTLQSGPAEAEFHPHDGQLYVVGLDGWQTAAQVDGSFERIRYTGKPVRLPSAFQAHADGIVIEFDEPIDPDSIVHENAVRVEQWNYRWTSTYGSYHYSIKEPNRVGHDVVPIDHISLSEDGHRLRLRIGDPQPVDQIQVSLDLRTNDGAPIKCDVYGTINAVTPSPEMLPPVASALLGKDNLVAWCIVPFDARRRGPEERAAMLEKLGIRKVAYDWRAELVPTFDAELEAYARHGIALHAFWMPVDTANPLEREGHWQTVLDLVRRHRVTPELWVMLNNALVEGVAETDRAQRAADILGPVARAAHERGCKLGLYNHGGWWGQPENQIRVVEFLRERGLKNTGLVYNFHHGHEHVTNFAQLARRMTPYLLTVNINGMRDGGPHILAVGQGDHERAMLDALIAAGYRGPIGILHHRDGVDAEEGLKDNLLGIERLLERD
jgi:sugar phosphate isomerase/epimerase